MGEYADEATRRMLDQQRWGGGYSLPEKVYRWEGEGPTPYINCKTVSLSLTELFTAEEGEIVRTPTNNVCPFCQKGGLHWSVVAGKNRLREEGGWLHHCAPVEGVTLSL